MWLQCTICKRHKPIYLFSKNVKRYNFGLDQRCKECSSKYQIKKSKIRRDLVYELKTLMGCQHCGYNTNPVALDLHHIDPDEKEIDIQLFRRSGCYDKFRKEVPKCVVLCKNCHALLHHADLELDIDIEYNTAIMDVTIEYLFNKYLYKLDKVRKIVTYDKKVKGVTLDKRSGRFRTRIVINNKEYGSKLFDDFTKAVQYRRELELKYNYKGISEAKIYLNSILTT